MILMRGSSRPPHFGKAGAGPGFAQGLVQRLATAFAITMALASTSAKAQRAPPPPPPVIVTTPPAVIVTPTVVVAPPTPSRFSDNTGMAAGATIANLGSNFLERLGNQATHGFGNAWRSNPGGGGASEATDEPRFRTWGETYGISATTTAQGDFVGDHRQTYGGVAGVGATIAPGVNVGFSIDQSRTAIDVPLAPQSATLDLTQFGFNASVDKGPWTWAIAVVHGLGNIDSSRDTGGGIASARYDGQIDGALTELSYYWSLDQSRIVPKLGLEYVHSATGAFQESGGLDPVAASDATLERARVLVGAEIGHYWIFDQKIFDLSAYGKFVDNFVQNFSAITVTLDTQSIALQGIGESQYGADVGAAASLNLTDKTRLYVNYDGKFRAAFQSHQGTLGVEYRW
jgi:uncharacterized protein with beta-barrel porin domain